MSGVLVLSDLDEDIERPVVTTFYSLRGGVGRSTALAYTARILAEHRRKVVCVDMDLEAPALSVLLGCESDVQDNQGVVDLLIALDQGTKPDFAEHLLPVTNSDNLFMVPAGRVSANYARKLRFINPSAWYREEKNPLRLLLDGLKNNLPFAADVILLDARTGITDLSGPLLFDLADIAVVVFFPHPQTKRGTELLARSLLNTKTGRPISEDRSVAPELRFLISPIPTSKSKEVIERYERRPLEWIDEWLEELNVRRQDDNLPPVVAEEITHFVRYREDVATSDQVGIDQDIWRAFGPVADWIERFIPTRTEPIIDESTKKLKQRAVRRFIDMNFRK
jgi:MinD-like ATPase involved in chromosome partitioning or flagellar assembly